MEGPLLCKKGPQCLSGDIRGRHGMADRPYQPCEASQDPAGGFPVPLPVPETPFPPPVYLPRSYQWKRPAKLPQPAAPASEPPQPAAPTTEPTQPAAAPRAATPPRVGPPHAHQPIIIWLLVLSPGHQPLLGGPMRIRSLANHCGALQDSILQPCA